VSPLAIILGYLALIVVGAYVGAYLWYRLVTWPRRQREAQEKGFAVVQGKKVFSDEVRISRPASFAGWLTGQHKHG
jgi:hypothetical protein